MKTQTATTPPRLFFPGLSMNIDGDCEYCSTLGQEGIVESLDLTMGRGYTAEARIDPDLKLLEYHISVGDMRVSRNTPINFCPKCGRDLNEV